MRSRFFGKYIWCEEELEEKYEGKISGQWNQQTMGDTIIFKFVVYISCTTYKNFVEIAPIFFELQ